MELRLFLWLCEGHCVHIAPCYQSASKARLGGLGETKGKALRSSPSFCRIQSL